MMMPEFTVKEYAKKEQVTIRTVQSWLAKGLVARSASGNIIAPEPTVSLADRNSYEWQWFSGVYFVFCDGLIKIGYAHDVRLRLKTLEYWNPHPIKPLGFIQCADATEARELEGALHAQFSHLNEHHEWFRDAPSLREFVSRSSSAWPAPMRRLA